MRRKVNHDKSDGLCGTLFPPNSAWKPPTSFPDLSGQKVLGLDIESRDPQLKERGPGFIRGDASVAGVSVSTFDASWYFPVGHLGGGNIREPDNLFAWLGDTFQDQDRFVVGANLQYELEGLDSRGVRIHGKLIDIQIAEALIDEEQPSYSLESVSSRRLGIGKDETLLKEAASAYGFTDVKANLWKLPSWYVGPYAEIDAKNPLLIFAQQKKILEAENLMPIFELESKILPILWEMRKRGVPIDLEKADRLSKEWKTLEDQKSLELMKLTGFFVDVWSGTDLVRIFTKNNWRYPTTAKGNASFEGEFLDSYGQPITDLISEIREINRMRTVFLDGLVSDCVKGRIHPQWRQIATDEGGTRTGRMACANPNAQQVPASKYRDTGKPNKYGMAIRSCYISDTGKWGKYDYKGQEPRVLTHFANLCKFTGAEAAAEAYRQDKEMNFYKYIVDSASVDMRVAKDMFLGLCYDMGLGKLCTKLGKPRNEGEVIINDFNAKVPFIKEIAESVRINADKRGYVKTLLGRRRHFNRWEPWDAWKRKTQNEEKIIPCYREEAEKLWPGVRLVRADTRKGLNSLIQGSAADMVKASMLKVYEETGDIPYLSVHDESDYPINDDEHAKVLLDKVEHAVDMTVPLYADMSIGEHWK